jgi:Mrp family chromosome partitioning ATPase/capsular polysaccharide biosynthesis protein
MRDVLPNRPTTLTDYVAILRRRKWIVVVPLVLAPVVAFILSRREQPLYRANAVVFVERTSVVSSLAKVGDPALGDPSRFLTTQASVARSSDLARRVVAAAGVPQLSPAAFLDESDVSPAGNADLLNFSVTDPDSHTAVVLANTYATQYTWYKTQLDTASIYAALQVLRGRIKWVESHPSSALASSYGSLLEQETQLETIGKLLASNTKVGQPASGALQTQPQPKRDVGLAAALGFVLAVGFAFLAEALDRRVRSERELAETLVLPVLARIPAPRRRLRRDQQLVMLAEPESVHAEVFRKLRTNLEFCTSGQDVRTILFTSAVHREGKSTTIANLAVAFARAHRRVAVVDLDLRGPFLNRLFHVAAAPGVSDVVLGRVSLQDAVRRIALTPPSLSPVGETPRDHGRGPGAGEQLGEKASVESEIHLLPGGTLLTSAAEAVESQAISLLLDALRDEFDLVLVDGPPLLAFGDAMALSSEVDAIVGVSRLGLVTRSSLEEFGRELRGYGEKSIGIVVTGASVEHTDYGAYRYLVTTSPDQVEHRLP